MKELERRGVATVALVSDDFIADHRRSAETMGLPDLPFARIAGPMTNESPQAIWHLVDGAFDALVTALVKAPVPAQALAHQVMVRPEPWLVFEGADLLEAHEEFNERFLDWQYGDGLLLRPATRRRLDEMLAGTTRAPDDVVGILDPGGGFATVEKIAVNAIMAGCQPRHLPIVIAAVECLADTNMDLREKAISTGPAAPMLVVNGPARHLAGLNTGVCMLGPGAPSRSNTVIGRAVRLCMMNIGHTWPGVSDMDTIGSPNKYSMVVAENEEHSPWAPYHVEQGLPGEASSVTLGFVYGLTDLTDYQSTAPETAVRKFATGPRYMCVTSTGYWLYGRRSDPRYGNAEQEHHYFLLTPIHARIFADAGWTKDDLRTAIHREARHPFEFLSSRLEASAIRASHPDLHWLWDSPDALVPVLEDAQCYKVVVAGSAGSNRSGFAWGMGGAVTKQVREEDLGLGQEGA